MVAIIQFLVMVFAFGICVIFACESWQLYSEEIQRAAAIDAVLSVFFLGVAVIMAMAMTDEAEKNYAIRSRQSRKP